jgi:hypothetical protein
MNTELDTLKKYGSSFQSKCISAILFDKSFLDTIFDIISEDFFESESNKWIVKTICEYYIKYKTSPTLDVFKHKIEDLKNKTFEQDIINSLKVAHSKLDESDLTYIKEQFLEFCKNQKIKSAIFESAELLKIGSYDDIKLKIDEALKAGMEKNDGHDYTTEIDERLSQSCRLSIPTNIECLDLLLDGGLGPGELGVVVGASGAGKCVGPNTEIEISYNEMGIEINGPRGPYMLWINPYDKYDIGYVGNSDSKVFGWQIYNILWEIENMMQCDPANPNINL